MATNGYADNGTVRRLVVLCVSLTAALNVPVFYILAEHASDFSEIRSSIRAKTSDRWHRADQTSYATAHEKLIAVQFRNVYFRFERNEAQIQFCTDEIRKLKE